MHVAVVINPTSGARGRPEVARRRAELAAAVLTAEGVQHAVQVTERAGHAYELARQAVAEGATLVCAWGGDGTVNEVGCALAFGSTALGIIPAGSGNGLARELHVPREPVQALKGALLAAEQVIDAGEIGGRLFFNAAGIGFDALIAARFNSRTHGRRGLWRYCTVAAHELFTYEAREYTIAVNGETGHHRALLIALANSRQYGNGMVIASQAQLHDGALDLVVVEGRSPLAILWEARRLFMNTLPSAKGVIMKKAQHLTVCAEAPLLFHVDGEPVVGGRSLTARVHPGALRIRRPA